MRKGILKGGMVVDVEHELERAGIDIVNWRDDWADFVCPLHEDHKPSATINLDTGWWLCRAGCGEGWIQTLTGLEPEAVEIDDELIQKLMNPVDRPKRSVKIEPYQHGVAPQYMLDRGFTLATLKKWDIGWRPADRAVVIPLIEEGEVLGHLDRLLFPESNQGKYNNSDGLTKSDHLFGLDIARGYGKGEVVVVEGPLDAIWVDQCGYPAVAIMGGSLSKRQEVLLNRNFLSIITAFDNDNTGRIATTDVFHRLAPQMHVRIARCPAGRKDIQECSPQEVSDMLSQAQEGI